MSKQTNPKKPLKLDTMGKTNAPKITTLNGTKSKETIYIDVDDEITTIIEKVSAARGDIVALVLPKRASVLQSVVNMKLLKRGADDASKNLVLITNETGLMPLAGLVGMFVAETPSSKPSVPPAPQAPSDEPESIEEPVDVSEGTSHEFDPSAAAAVPIGVLAASQGLDVETITLDDEPFAESAAALEDVTPVKKDKRLKVPSFNKFRVRLVLIAIGIILLVAGWVLAAIVLPKATIAITTDSSTVTSNLPVTLDTAAKQVDTTNSIVPAIAQTTQKSDTQQVPTTGEKNNGDKATGTVTLESSVCALPAKKPADIPTGSTVTSNSHTYFTQKNATFSNPTLNSSGTCLVYTSNVVSIIALKTGSDYNTASSSASFTGPNGSTGTGSADGGTDVIIKIVAQSDIDAAKAKIAAQDTAQVRQDLQAVLKGKGLMPVDATFLAGDQQVTTSANAGDTADTVTVNATTTYSMLGVKEGDLKLLITNTIADKIDSKRQKILDDGIAKAQFSEQNPGSVASAVVTMKVKSVIGPSIDVSAIKKQIAGKKAGDIQDSLKQSPDITDVSVHYSPFWVTRVPSNIDKITVKIDGQIKN